MSVFVVPHDPAWTQAFDKVSKAIRRALGEDAIGLHHIGSTAMAGILAKPIIDMLGIVENLAALDHRNAVMAGLGFLAMGPNGIEGRRFFRKSDAAGQRTHHLHVFEQGSSHIERHLAFRDYLKNHPRKAAEYSDLKALITTDHAISRDAYMDAKDPFIAATMKDAVEWYRMNWPVN